MAALLLPRSLLVGFVVIALAACSDGPSNDGAGGSAGAAQAGGGQQNQAGMAGMVSQGGSPAAGGGGTPAKAGAAGAGAGGLGGLSTSGGGGAGGAGAGSGGNLGTGGLQAGAPGFGPSFYIGADVTFDEPQPEATRANLLTTLKQHGFNAIRLRAFVDPKAADGYDKSNGMADTAHTAAFGKQIKAHSLA